METISLQGIVSFFILGRQWTDGNGNTYFANKIFIGGEDTPDIDDCLRISPYSPALACCTARAGPTDTVSSGLRMQRISC